MDKEEYAPIKLYSSENTERILRICRKIKEEKGSQNFTPEDVTAKYVDVFHYSWDLHELDDFVKFLKSKKGEDLSQLKCLEIGSGICGPTRYLSWKYGLKFECLEIMPELIDLAQRINALFDSCNGFQDKIQIFNLDFMKMDLTPYLAKYDFVITQQVLSHIPDKQLYLQRMSQCLKPGGIFFMNEWALYSDLDEEEVKLAVDTWEIRGKIPSYEQWVEFSKNAGLEILQALDVTEEVTQFLWERYQRYVRWQDDPNAQEWQRPTKDVLNGWGVGPMLFRKLTNQQDYPVTLQRVGNYANKPGGMAEIYFYGQKPF